LTEHTQANGLFFLPCHIRCQEHDDQAIHALHTSALTSLPLLARGKVRDNYAVGDDRILMVASDRISAFDVIMGEPIPGKGELLTKMALFWFDKLGPNGLDICPIHLTGDAPESVVTPAEVPQVRGRSMLVKRLQAHSGGSRGARLPGWQRLAGIPGQPLRMRGTPARGTHQRQQAARTHLHPCSQSSHG
jgi:phosphoribosylaminoimidazole-succinocarboxamide synthase